MTPAATEQVVGEQNGIYLAMADPTLIVQNFKIWRHEPGSRLQQKVRDMDPKTNSARSEGMS